MVLLSNKNFPDQVSREYQLHDIEMATPTSTEIRPSNCVDEEKDMKHCMQIHTNLASQGQSKGEADKRKEISSCASSPGCMEKHKPRRGCKRATDQSSEPNKGNVEMPKPKRGRPKRVKISQAVS